MLMTNVVILEWPTSYSHLIQFPLTSFLRAEDIKARAKVNAVLLWHGSTLRLGSGNLMNYRVLYPLLGGKPRQEDIVTGFLLPALQNALKVGAILAGVGVCPGWLGFICFVPGRAGRVQVIIIIEAQMLDPSCPRISCQTQFHHISLCVSEY